MTKILPITLALAALIALPVRTQVPLVTFLLVLAAFALDDYDRVRPYLLGAIAAALIIHDQSFLYAIALLALVRRRDAIPFAVIALVPSVVWLRRIHWRPELSEWVVIPWSEFFHHPLQNALLPFATVHIALHIETHDLLAMIPWPLLLTGIAALWVLRREIPRTRRTALVAALTVLFALQQLVLAPFDTENNPNRAMPAVLAFGIAWCWIAAKLWPRRAWRVAIVAVVMVCAVVGVSRNPAIAYLATPQAIDNNPKEPIVIFERGSRSP